MSVELNALRQLLADVRYALRPYNGTGYHDMDGRTTAEVAGEVADAVRAYDEALGVDPAGTTDPQGDGTTTASATVAENWQTVHDFELERLQAEVERLRARVAALIEAGDAMHPFVRSDGFVARTHWMKVRGDDLDPQPEEDGRGQ